MKKETTLSVLKEIRNLLSGNQKIFLQIFDSVRPPEPKKELENFIKVNFPNKTAKEIMDECGNKLGDGKLLYDTNWYENEDFFTKEKCRPGVRYVSKELIGKGKDWNECVALLKDGEREMLNFAEALYFVQEYYKQKNSYPWNSDWSWTSSRSSYGPLVNLGRCDAGGVGVGYYVPRYSFSFLGVCFSRSEILNLE